MERRVPQTLDPQALRDGLAGHVSAPGDDDWDVARLAWNLAADQNPALVAMPESPEDVVAVVNFARDNGLRVAPQATGHHAAVIEDLGDAVLLKTSRMNSVEIDPDKRIARAGAGAIWQQVTGSAAEHGLAALAGSADDVGVLGYTLGGGISWMARRHGLATNGVVAIEAVTADGRAVRASADSEPDLFWAMRGGGGNFAAATAIEFSLYPVPELYAGALFWPIERAGDVLHAWREWVETVPDEVTSVGRLLNFPPLPEIPEPMRGNSFVVVEAASCHEDLGAAPELLAPLRELEPHMDTCANIAPPALVGLHMDPPEPVPASGDGFLLADAPAKAIDAIIGHAGAGSNSSLLSAELRHLGGRLANPNPGDGALSTLDADFVYFGVGMAPDPAFKQAVEADLDRLRSALSPWEAETAYMNFAERPIDTARMFPSDVYQRLRRVKTDYDPTNVFQANHPIAASD